MSREGDITPIESPLTDSRPMTAIDPRSAVPTSANRDSDHRQARRRDDDMAGV